MKKANGIKTERTIMAIATSESQGADGRFNRSIFATSDDGYLFQLQAGEDGPEWAVIAPKLPQGALDE